MGVRFRIYIIRFKVSKLTHFPIYVKEKARLCGRGGKYTLRGSGVIRLCNLNNVCA